MSWPPRSTRSMISSVGTGVGAVLTPMPQPGLNYSGVQWYRNGVAISGAQGGNDVPYVKKAIDVPAKGAPDIAITCELTGLTAMTLPDISSNP